MSRIWLRAVLAALLVMTVATKIRGSPPLTREQFAATVIDVLAAQGLADNAIIAPARGILPVAVQLEPSQCKGKIEIIPVSLNLQEAPLFASLLEPTYKRQFAFLDRTWRTEDRVGIRLTWAKHKTSYFLGLGQFAASTPVLLIASPPDCAVLDSIDWSPVWSGRRTAVAKRGQ
jgi:hypothetical protein